MESLLGRKEAAEAAYRRVVELAPGDPRSPTALAKFLLQEGDLEEALRLYRRALDLAPLFEDAERGLVTVWMLQDCHDQARRHLREIYEEAPHDGFRSGIHFALAVTYADQGEYALAVEELEKNFALCAKIHDSLAMAIDLNNMIDMLLEAGRFDEAEKRNEELLRHLVDDPGQPEGRRSRNGGRSSRTGVLSVWRPIDRHRADANAGEDLARFYKLAARNSSALVVEMLGNLGGSRSRTGQSSQEAAQVVPPRVSERRSGLSSYFETER